MNVYMYILLIALPFVFCGRRARVLKDPRLQDTCNTVYCALGQECVETYFGGECECISRCFDSRSPVCGNNGRTYESKCELYKDACLKNKTETITLVADTSCEQAEILKKQMSNEVRNDESKPKPVVCMQKERNEIRSSIVDWLHKNTKHDHNGSTYDDQLKTHFNGLDLNKDTFLDVEEFEKLAAIVPELSKSKSKWNGLCFGEIIAITDDDYDYKLKFKEFYKCLKPDFSPPHLSCELESTYYEDGDEVQQECNTCKCACGNWVCTAIDCNKFSIAQ